jgi:hypothetical protein
MHTFEDFNPPLAAYFLSDQFLGENRFQIGRRQGLLGARMQRRRDWFWQVRPNIAPGRGNVFFAQKNALGIRETVLNCR